MSKSMPMFKHNPKPRPSSLEPSSALAPTAPPTRVDRSFDEIADHFEKKVYGGLKGEIRLAVLRRDLMTLLPRMQRTVGRPLRILDVGAGLAHLGVELAAQGHHVVINDISAQMIAKARARAALIQQPLDITWLVCPYQTLPDRLDPTDQGKFDVILCHALLEWLAEPVAIMGFFEAYLCDHGALSLCFYNPASFVYRNLIMGNFNLLEDQRYQADNIKSLTPNYPVSKAEVDSWLEEHAYEIVLESGLRVFHDYVTLKRGGHAHPDEVIRMELAYSLKAPYKHLGRYLHVLARRRPDATLP